MKKQIGIVILTAAALLVACGGQKAETAAVETTAAAETTTAAETAAENTPETSGEETEKASEAESETETASETVAETASEAESDTAAETEAPAETSAAEEDTSASTENAEQEETTAPEKTDVQPETDTAAETAESPAAAAVSPQSVYEAVSAQVSLPAMFLADDDFISNYYGVDPADLNSYVFASAEEATLADTVILMNTKGGDAKARITAALNTVLEQKAAEMENYLPDQYEIVAKSTVYTEGDWVYLVISAQADAIEAVIRGNLN